jgi:FkbM family methyltransferase
MPNLVLHAHDEYISRYIRAYNCWEPVLTEVITELIAYAHALQQDAATHTFVDVGANLGYFSVWVASLPGNIGVVAWEPIHENLQLLRQNVALNNLQDRVTILPYAAGWQGNRLTQFFVNSSNMGVCSSVQLGQPCGTQWVQERDLSQAMREIEPTKQWILKVDVEEQELDLLTSFTLATWAKIDVLILEVAPQNAIEVLALVKPHFDWGLNMGEQLAAGSLREEHNHLAKLERIEEWVWRDVQYQTNIVVCKNSFCPVVVLELPTRVLPV